MEKININVGQLQSVPSVYANVSDGLLQFNQVWKSGHTAYVSWNLTNLSSGHINVSAVSFFLAIAHRVRIFTEKRQPILIDWHPTQLSFLDDIGFFKISHQLDLFDWPFEIGGYDNNVINPNTRILTFNQIYELPDYADDKQLSNWKKLHREQYRREIIAKCEALFSSEDLYSIRELPLIMSRTCAELVTNSLLWGNATSFLALQRTHTMIVISVTDIGRGFRSSLNSKNMFNKREFLNSDINAIAIGSIINHQDFGLKRAIATVIELGGTISITSNSGEIRWGKKNWLNYINNINEYGIDRAIKNLPFPIRKSTAEQKNNGYVRYWDSSIRGTRIEFYIPLRKGYSTL